MTTADSGNRLYQSLGNLKVNPLIGIVIPDYDTSDALYLTGHSTILLGKQASDLIARSNMAVKITISASRLVKSSLPFRGTPNEPSPYNPPVRYLLSERAPGLAPTDRPDINATLVARDILTPTIAVFTFKLETRDVHSLPQWQPGHHITINFEVEVSGGYAHMNDRDPQSLNDDYVRTFTVSSPPHSLPQKDHFQITARLHGPVTKFLWRHNTRVPLDLQVMGFGGKDAFALPVSTTATTPFKEPVYVAGGVGITPILAQAKAVLDAAVPLTLLWTLRGEDLALAIHAFDKIPGLAEKTMIFATGSLSSDDTKKLLEKIRERGAAVQDRRIKADDFGEIKGGGKKFYLCTSPSLLTSLRGWLEGEDVVWEDFGY